VGHREFDTDLDRMGRVGGRRFVAREGRNEFMRPTYWNGTRAGLVKGVIAFIGVVAIGVVVALLILLL
jgi:hypothetical protein